MTHNEVLVEQYKLLISAFQTDEGTRESSNQFWVTLNSIGLSAVTYMQDIKHSTHPAESYLIFGLIALGVFLNLLWLSSLVAIKEKIETKRKVIVGLEKQLNSQVFSQLLIKDKVFFHGTSLTQREMFTPSMFILGFVLLGFLFYYFWVPLS